MTTAKLEYRNYVPSSWIATKFLNVYFYGDMEKELEKQWHEIEFKKYDSKQKEIEKLRIKKESVTESKINLMDDLSNEHKKRKWYKPFETKVDKEIANKIHSLWLEENRIQDNVEEIKGDLFYDTSTLIRMIEKLLKDNNFSPKSTSCAGMECVTHTDIWEKS